MNAQLSEWITLATIPPTRAAAFDALVEALNATAIPIELEENLARQCENDVAFWLRVHESDLPLAWDLARRLTTESQ